MMVGGPYRGPYDGAVGKGVGERLADFIKDRAVPGNPALGPPTSLRYVAR